MSFTKDFNMSFKSLLKRNIIINSFVYQVKITGLNTSFGIFRESMNKALNFFCGSFFIIEGVYCYSFSQQFLEALELPLIIIITFSFFKVYLYLLHDKFCIYSPRRHILSSLSTASLFSNEHFFTQYVMLIFNLKLIFYS